MSFEWRPIETAPKDGGILLWTRRAGWQIAECCEFFEKGRPDGTDDWVWYTEMGTPLDDATHWMPLPPPPERNDES